MSAARRRIERSVILGPSLVRRLAAGQTTRPEDRWMLGQPRPVRESFVHEVLDSPGDPELLQQIWMMYQPDAVRESYVLEVLEPALEDPPDVP